MVAAASGGEKGFCCFVPKVKAKPGVNLNLRTALLGWLALLVASELQERSNNNG